MVCATAHFNHSARFELKLLLGQRRQTMDQGIRMCRPASSFNQRNPFSNLQNCMGVQEKARARQSK